MDINTYSIGQMEKLIQQQGRIPNIPIITPLPEKPAGDAGRVSDHVKLALPVAGSVSVMPEVVVYEHINFGGADWRTNLGWGYVGDWWNDKISSIIVVSGTWRFYLHANFQGPYWDLKQGYYNWVENARIPNDVISSFQCISW